VGQAAKLQAVTNYKNIFYAIKRFIGRRHNDKYFRKSKEPYDVLAAVTATLGLTLEARSTVRVK
jgi:molecular chaperone DnaK